MRKLWREGATRAAPESPEDTLVGQRWSAGGGVGTQGGSGRRRDVRRQGGWPGAALGASELRAFSRDEGSFVVKRNVWGTVLALFLLSLFLGLSSLFLSFYFSFISLWWGGVREQEIGVPRLDSQ